MHRNGFIAFLPALSLFDLAVSQAKTTPPEIKAMILSAAFLFRGEQVAPIVVAEFGVLAVVVGMTYLIVRFLRKRRRGAGLLLVPLPFILCAGVLWAWTRSEPPGAVPPKLFPGSEVRRMIGRLPNYAPFGYTGAAYFQGSLYIGSNIGLLKVENGALSGLYQLHNKDSVVSGPWFDRANHLLWLLDDHTHELVAFDGSTWQRMHMPKPASGYYSRGDVLEGVRPAGNDQAFWIAAAGSVWRWSPADRRWVSEKTPELAVSGRSVIEGSVIGVLPINGRLAYIVRRQSLSFLVKPGENFVSDTIVVSDGSGWREIRPRDGTAFLAELWTAANSSGYICDQNGVMFTVSAEQIVQPKIPGRCEALSEDPSGSLVASFRGLGMFRLQGENWQLLASPISGSGLGDYWTHLATAGEEAAYVMSAKPVVDHERSTGEDMRWKQNAPTTVWVIRGSQAAQVEMK